MQLPDSHGRHAKVDGEGTLARTALRSTAFTEKWLPAPAVLDAADGGCDIARTARHGVIAY